jgi:hypothetical protein
MGTVVTATPRPLYPRERDPVPIVEEAGFALRPVWMSAENLALTGIRSPHRSVGSEALNRSLIRLLIFFCAAISGGKKTLALYSGYYNAVPTVSAIQCAMI